MANKNYKSVEKNEIEKSELKEYYIAFLDILGYKKIIEKCDTIEKEFSYLEIINNSFNEAIQMITNDHLYQNELSDLKYNTFSDNIVLGLPKENVTASSFLYYIELIRSIYFLLLSKYNLVLRGGVSFGNYYQNNNISFGSGLVKAYELEGKATYPRVIFDKNMIVDILENKNNECLFLKFKKAFYNCFRNKSNYKELYDVTLSVISNISFFNCNSLDEDACFVLDFLDSVISAAQKGEFPSCLESVKDVDALIENIENKYKSMYKKSMVCFYNESLISFDENDSFFTLNPFEKKTSIIYISEPKSSSSEKFIKYSDGSFKHLEMEDKDHYIYCHTINDFMISKEENLQQLNEIKEFIIKQIKFYESILSNNEENDSDITNKILNKYLWLKDFFNSYCKKNLKRNFLNYQEYRSLMIN